MFARMCVCLLFWARTAGAMRRRAAPKHADPRGHHRAGCPRRTLDANPHQSEDRAASAS